MPLREFNPVGNGRGGQVSRGELRRVAEAVEQQDRVTGEGDLQFARNAAGVQLLDTRLQKIFIRITAGDAGSGSGSGGSGGSGGGASARYAWVQVAGDSETTWVVPDGMSGTVAATPAVEVNGNTAVPVGTIAEATIDPVNVCVRFAFGGVGAGGGAVVLILDATIGIQSHTQSGCGSGHGDCPELYQNAVLQTYDPVCDAWNNGACVTVVEANSKRLEVGRRYDARLIGTTPLTVQATISPVSNVVCTGQSSALYLVDAGGISRVIQVTSHLGSLCPSGSGAASGAVNLDVYRGQAVRWNPLTCKWELIEDDVLVAHVSGCALAVGTRYMAHWHNNVTAAEIGGSGSGSGHCTPLYLTQVRVGQYVTDVLCVGGVTKVYRSIDDCGTSAYSHDAGCCACGSPGSGSSSGGGGCPCSGKPTAAHFHVGTFALTNATCTNCAVFPATFDITNTAACQWDSSTLPSGCGGSAGATLSYDAGTNTFILFISAGIFGASYSIPAASFNCNGSNVLTFVSAGGGCTNWPATVTLTPF